MRVTHPTRSSTVSTTQRSTKIAANLLAFVIILSSISGVAFADSPGKHPQYLHALSDLRAARWMLEHRPGNESVSADEGVAIEKIDAAIFEIKKAAIDDGKDLHDHPVVDAPRDHAGRLHKAEELLKKVHSDVDREEEDPAAKGLKHRALEHIEAAHRATKRAIEDTEHYK